MKKINIITLMICTLTLISCNSDTLKNNQQNEVVARTEKETNTWTESLKPIKSELPTIGLLMYNGVLQSEVFSISDVFAKPSEEGTQLFNVITIAETGHPIITEEGMKIIPDYTFKNSPTLTALFIPSANDMAAHVQNKEIIQFIQQQNKETKYTISNCAGAQLIGKSKIADGHKIVTWIGGGKELQKEYPKLKVQNDSEVTFVTDGKFSSSNGSLTSYISALHVLEKMTNPEHRTFVESYLYLDRLQNWNQ